MSFHVPGFKKVKFSGEVFVCFSVRNFSFRILEVGERLELIQIDKIMLLCFMIL